MSHKVRSTLGSLAARGPLPRLRSAVALAAIVAAAIGVPSAGASVTLPPGSMTVPSSGTFLYMNSQPGDYIGGGTEQLYTSADSSINGSVPQGGDFFSASVIQGPYTHWWYVNIAAPPVSRSWWTRTPEPSVLHSGRQARRASTSTATVAGATP